MSYILSFLKKEKKKIWKSLLLTAIFDGEMEKIWPCLSGIFPLCTVFPVRDIHPHTCTSIHSRLFFIVVEGPIHSLHTFTYMPTFGEKYKSSTISLHYELLLLCILTYTTIQSIVVDSKLPRREYILRSVSPHWDSFLYFFPIERNM